MIPFYRQYKFWFAVLTGFASGGQIYWHWSADTIAQVMAFGGMVLGALLGSHALLSDQTTCAPSGQTKPSAVPPVTLILALGLGLLAGPVAAQTVAADTVLKTRAFDAGQAPGRVATAETSPLLDFGSLLPAAHGQQLTEGMQGFDVVGVTPLYLLKNKRTGKLCYADPIELSAGRLAVHTYLIAYASLGWPTSRWHAQERAVELVEIKARQALARAGAVALTQIPQIVGRADTLVAGVLRGLSGR